MQMRAFVDRDACISCGLCATICPEVFEMDDEDIATVIADPVPAEHEDGAQEAADSCPTDAISIEE
jgi:ferredoxin